MRRRRLASTMRAQRCRGDRTPRWTSLTSLCAAKTGLVRLRYLLRHPTRRAQVESLRRRALRSRLPIEINRANSSRRSRCNSNSPHHTNTNDRHHLSQYSTSRRLSDGSTQLSFNVVVNSNEQGSRQIANKIEGLTSLGDMNVDSAEVDECDRDNCVTTITSYTVAEEFEYDESNYAAEGASNSGMAAGVVGAVGACALVVGAAVAAKKRGYFAAAMKSEEVVTENPVREAELV